MLFKLILAYALSSQFLSNLEPIRQIQIELIVDTNNVIVTLPLINKKRLDLFNKIKNSHISTYIFTYVFSISRVFS